MTNVLYFTYLHFILDQGSYEAATKHGGTMRKDSKEMNCRRMKRIFADQRIETTSTV